MEPPLPEVLVRRSLQVEEVGSDDPDAVLSEEVKKAFPHIYKRRLLHLTAAPLSPTTLKEPFQPLSRAAQPLRVAVASVSNAVAAAGAHNAILGLRAFLDRPELANSKLFGIRNLAKGAEFEIDFSSFEHYLNQAGSDMLPTVPLMHLGNALLNQVNKWCERLELDGLVFLCGPSEVAQIAKIAEHLEQIGSKTVLNVVLHSISGWVRLPGWIDTNLGFDSSCSVLSEMAGNIALSRQSLNKDIYHFVACGSKTLTLEVAMQVRPMLCYIGEDVAEMGLTLRGIVNEICEVIVARHHQHSFHAGLVMVSDDFFEQLSEMKRLRAELHRLRQEQPMNMRSEEQATKLLEPGLAEFFAMLPGNARHALVFRNSPDGLPFMPSFEAERELGNLVARVLSEWLRDKGPKHSVEHFEHHPHSLRHIALSPMPTQLDCAMGYAFGHIAGALVKSRRNGLVASVQNLASAAPEWTPCAVPLVRLLTLGPERQLTVRRRQLREEEEFLFRLWRRVREPWRYQQSYREPGPVQFWGPGGSRPLSWTTYTLMAEFVPDEVTAEVASELNDAPQDFFLATWPMPFRLVRRRMELLTPLQKWRCTYEPLLPEVLRGDWRIAEEDRKGRVCADTELVRAAFPGLWRTDNLKAVRVEPKPQEVSVLQMLPEGPLRGFDMDGRGMRMRRDDSWGGSLASGGSGGDLAGRWRTTSPSSGPGHAKRPSGQGDNSPEGSPKDWEGATTEGAPSELVEFGLRHINPRVGFVLIGRSGPGVNNVIQGIFDYMQKIDGKLFCIAMGVAGLVKGQCFEVTEELLAPYRNQGGCDLLGQSHPEDLQHIGSNLSVCAQTVQRLELAGLVVWGGRRAHGWTAKLAEYFAEHQVPTCVIGVPASVQSDLPLIEQTIGYDSVCKLFSSIVGNLATQAASSGKIWAFVRIPGRSISHIAAEVALETHPHVVLLSADSGPVELGMAEVTQMICNVIEARSKMNKNYGVVLIPDQLLATVREMKQLFEEIDQICKLCPDAVQSPQTLGHDFSRVLALLPPLSRALFQSFPEMVRAQICHLVAKGGLRGGQIDLANVETEVIFESLVEMELSRRVVLGTYNGPFQVITYSLPYHGRSAMPTNFDCDLGYTMGYAAGIFIEDNRSGILIDIRKQKEDVKHWEVGGTSLTSLLTFQDTSGYTGRPTNYEIKPRSRLLYDHSHERSMPEPRDRTLVSPGPAQFEGPCAGLKTQTLCMPQLQRVRQMARSEQLITELKANAKGCPPEVLQAVKMLLQGGVDLLRQI